MPRPKSKNGTTLANARTMLRAVGYTISKRCGEYRVAPLHGTPRQREDRASYQASLDDALQTAMHDARRRTVHD